MCYYGYMATNVTSCRSTSTQQNMFQKSKWFSKHVLETCETKFNDIINVDKRLKLEITLFKKSGLNDLGRATLGVP